MQKEFDILVEARSIFDKEIAAIEKTKNALNEDFETVAQLILECTGKVIFSFFQPTASVQHSTLQKVPLRITALDGYTVQKLLCVCNAAAGNIAAHIIKPLHLHALPIVSLYHQHSERPEEHITHFRLLAV